MYYWIEYYYGHKSRTNIIALRFVSAQNLVVENDWICVWKCVLRACLRDMSENLCRSIYIIIKCISFHMFSKFIAYMSIRYVDPIMSFCQNRNYSIYSFYWKWYMLSDLATYIIQSVIYCLILCYWRISTWIILPWLNITSTFCSSFCPPPAARKSDLRKINCVITNNKQLMDYLPYKFYKYSKDFFYAKS